MEFFFGFIAGAGSALFVGGFLLVYVVVTNPDGDDL